ncbi:glutathione peroxidase [Myroides pelagicus]|uniref:Glutathione peroxidase n=1 Tax=Myroides pelagicus TaxID=270914 RepID=A0A7K1GMH8_9FLAO|nr:glutathione peroxidase [Myroides pelagicus]MEC4114181.1 glutathione peroxidase [Myroides pelagicus]MTH29739.1 glutathione peroxidase [Myroides pelagicus]
MRKIVLIASLLISGASFASITPNINTEIMNKQKKDKTIYQFKVKDINGDEFDFATLKGKKILIVNTASECGLTPQYKQLQSIYDEFGAEDFIIVGFPANNFGAQEPGTNQEIATFCQANYGVTFPMMEKISVKGDDIAPIYAFLTQKSQNGFIDSTVEWNFQKYLIDEKGHLQAVINPRILPTDPEIKDWIKNKITAE